MRKKEKEITDAGVIEGILGRAVVCRLGLCEDNRAYVVPVCFGYEDNALYIHCAREGNKIDILRKNNNVCFEVEVGQKVVKRSKACEWAMEYQSVIGFGKAVFIEEPEAKRKAFDTIMRKFSESDFEYPENVVEKTVVIKVEIESMTGKKSK